MCGARAHCHGAISNCGMMINLQRSRVRLLWSGHGAPGRASSTAMDAGVTSAASTATAPCSPTARSSAALSSAAHADAADADADDHDAEARARTESAIEKAAALRERG